MAAFRHGNGKAVKFAALPVTCGQERSRVISRRRVSPMIPVADLEIPAQKFSTEAQDTFCDDMAFTPWHALPEHKPLGVVNRTRFVVYTATAKLRREGNGVVNRTALTGPTGDESI